MHKVLIVIGLAVVFAIPAHADITIYESGGDTLRIGGWADVRAVNTQDETELVDGFSRLKLSFARDMGDEWEAVVVIETGINLVGETGITFSGGDSLHTRRDDLLNLRLGYVGVSHSDYGELTLGKQWGAYYDVAGITDWGRVWGASASGAYNFNGDGGLSGTGRAEKAVLYRKSFGDISISLQGQLQAVSDEIDNLLGPSDPDEQLVSIDYDSTVAASVTYEFGDGHMFAASVNEGTFTGTFEDGDSVERDDRIAAIGYRYGEYGDGLYLGLLYSESEFHELDNLGRVIPDSTGIEVFASYRGDSRWLPYALYNSLEADDSYESRYEGDVFHREYYALGSIWFWNEETDFFFEARIDSSDMSTAQQEIEDDGVALGMRYRF